MLHRGLSVEQTSPFNASTSTGRPGKQGVHDGGSFPTAIRGPIQNGSTHSTLTVSAEPHYEAVAGRMLRISVGQVSAHDPPRLLAYMHPWDG